MSNSRTIMEDKTVIAVMHQQTQILDSPTLPKPSSLLPFNLKKCLSSNDILTPPQSPLVHPILSHQNNVRSPLPNPKFNLEQIDEQEHEKSNNRSSNTPTPSCVSTSSSTSATHTPSSPSHPPLVASISCGSIRHNNNSNKNKKSTTTTTTISNKQSEISSDEDDDDDDDDLDEEDDESSSTEGLHSSTTAFSTSTSSNFSLSSSVVDCATACQTSSVTSSHYKSPTFSTVSDDQGDTGSHPRMRSSRQPYQPDYHPQTIDSSTSTPTFQLLCKRRRHSTDDRNQRGHLNVVVHLDSGQLEQL
ncbi:hypothetical protein PPL_00445 [Heterostelium album PN500]|uniref:Uncharacterized protein n=1 Tax=Heterostelium pallidum (strain ATCC 26659 / Pp 5 / PN500) TaxID=670386 RepID=D3AWH1_HETP5|nr:hypothetical protein PPL_00445 [Heterostelium album PN500]EFA86644.1 hypothetical protein PPL_00445 [Heterostelium album PN500]|eukprot:XP_020438749.1 hypothetical protein PPL_00445 [Heterostelium album PN500]